MQHATILGLSSALLSIGVAEGAPVVCSQAEQWWDGGILACGPVAGISPSVGTLVLGGTTLTSIGAGLTAPGGALTIGPPTATTPGGALATSCAAGSFVTGLSTTESLTCGTPGAGGTKTAFTPSATFQTIGTGTFAYTTQSGYYVTNAGVTTVKLSIAFTPTLGTAAGPLQISEPVSASNDSVDNSCAVSNSGTQAFPVTDTQLVAWIPVNKSFVMVAGFKNASGPSTISAGNIGATAWALEITCQIF